MSADEDTEGRSLGSGHLFGVHAGKGGDAHADCPAASLYFSWSIRGLFNEDTSSCQSSQVNLKDRKRDGRAARGELRREAALRAA